jgi:predicted AAA+ superfamily ATPase
MPVEREALAPLVERLKEPRRFLQVVTGPRQVGKTTLVRQALERLERDAQANTTSPTTAPLAQHSASADGPGLQGQIWRGTQWQVARALADQAGGCVLVLDEIQKVSQWTEEVKRLWDEDTAAGRDVRVVILGSAPLLIARGLSESMAGRFEITRLGHWRYAEMRDAFGFSLEQFIFYGGYPGAAPLVHDESRWAAYVSDALIETTISKDVLLMAPVQNPRCCAACLTWPAPTAAKSSATKKCWANSTTQATPPRWPTTWICWKALAWPVVCPNTWAKWCANAHPAPNCKCSTTP